MYSIKTSRGYLKCFIPKSERKDKAMPEPVFTKYEHEAKKLSRKSAEKFAAWLVHFSRNCQPVLLEKLK